MQPLNVAYPTETAVPANSGKQKASQTSALNEGPFGLALLLAGLAGWVDATGISRSGGVFLSFMSGNTTDLGLALTQQDWLTAKTIGVVIVLFVAGVVLGELVGSRAGRYGHSVVLLLEALFLAIGAAVQWQLGALTGRYEDLALCPLVLAMGIQNATMHRAGGLSLGLTYVTGALVQMGRALAQLNQPDARRRVSMFLSLWVSLAAGAALAAGLVAISMAAALAVAAAMAVVLAIATALVIRCAHDRPG